VKKKNFGRGKSPSGKEKRGERGKEEYSFAKRTQIGGEQNKPRGAHQGTAGSSAIFSGKRDEMGETDE